MEIALVAIIALIVLGPAKLPDAARAMGKGMREFKGALAGEDDDRDDGVHQKPEPTTRPTPASPRLPSTEAVACAERPPCR